MERRIRYAVLLLFTLLSGLAVRFLRMGLPHAVSKYGGSALWAAAIFWLLSLLAPYALLFRRVAAATLLAAGIEFFKLVYTPALDHFRLTLPGKLLLGRIFSLRDLLAYTLAIGVAAALDALTMRPRALG